MIKLVAFDWNGTLLADTQTSVAADADTFKFARLPPISIHQMRKTFDIPIIDYYIVNGMTERFFLKHQNTLRKIYHANYERLSVRCRTRSGSLSLLRWLDRNNIDRLIFSNHNVPNILFHLKRLKIDQYLQVILAQDSNASGPLRSRNKGAKLERYVESNGYKKSQVLVVGDTTEEIEIARTLGYRSVALTGGCCSTSRLKASQPDFLIHNLVELERIIRSLS